MLHIFNESGIRKDAFIYTLRGNTKRLLCMSDFKELKADIVRISLASVNPHKDIKGIPD